MYRIGDFSKITDVPIKTLRYYDEIDLFKPSYIANDSNYRYYEESQIKEIEYILELKDLNLSLQEIKDYITKHNMEILENKEQQVTNNSKDISNYILNNSKYDIELSDYKTFLENNGLSSLQFPYGKAMKENKARYYLISKNGKYYTDMIFNIENHILDSGPLAVENDDELRMIIKQLEKNQFKEVKIFIDNSVNKNILERLERVLNITKIEEIEEDKQNNSRYLYIEGVK